MSSHFASFRNNPRLRNYSFDDDLRRNDALNYDFVRSGFWSEEPSHVFIFALHRAKVNSQRMHRSCPSLGRLDTDFPTSRSDAYCLRCLTHNPNFIRLLNRRTCIANVFNHSAPLFGSMFPFKPPNLYRLRFPLRYSRATTRLRLRLSATV